MHFDSAGQLHYSPSDLVTYLEGDFAAWMDRADIERKRGTALAAEAMGLEPDPEDPELKLFQQAGLEHEMRFLAQLVAQGRRVVEISRGDRAATLDAMRAGADVIYQGHLEDGAFHGYPDFLFRMDGNSTLGSWHYEPWDTKLARSAKPYFVVQLCAYAELLDALQGRMPGRLMVQLGNHTEREFRTREFIHYFRHLRRAFEQFQAGFDPLAMPDPGRERSWGDWSEAARQVLEVRDHPRRVAGMTRGRIARLEAAGLTTMTALAQCDAVSVPRIGADAFHRLKAQARLQLGSRGLEHPLWEVVPPPLDEPFKGLGGLPPAHPADIYFDMEGFPLAEGGLEYLFGVVTLAEGKPEFRDWWAHNEVEEKRAFEEFVDWAWSRWIDHRGLHIYHYAGYEVNTLRRLMGKYGSREDRVDDLLRHEVFVDLYKVVRQGVRVGTPSYSLKEVERLYRPARAGDVTTAAGSVVEYQRWLDSGEPGDWQGSAILRGIRDYNRDDCVSTWELCDWLRARQGEHGIAFAAPKPSDEPTADAKEPNAADEMREVLLAAVEKAEDEDDKRTHELLAWLVGYHKREEKPMWWRLFDRRDASEEELFDDADCLAGVTRTETPPVPIKKSRGVEYAFDPDQDTKIRAGAEVRFAHDIDLGGEVVSMDEAAGRIVIKFGPSKEPPEGGNLIPFEHVPSKSIQEALLRYAQRHLAGDLGVGQAVDDLLRRRGPRLRGGTGGDLIAAGGELLPQLVDVVQRLDRTTLCIQGPPGTGKTWSSAQAIIALCRAGAKVGVSSNSHKAILNLMEWVAKLDGSVRLVKVGKDDEHALIESGRIVQCAPDAAGEAVLAGPLLLGGTAWAFCRTDLEGQLDYLFVDEAGQVPLANLVGMGLSARNIVLVGDQMQLAQPVQGTHPGESGASCLMYALHGHATVPPDRGVFLGKTRRMHPAVNRFISDAVYEGRLEADPITSERCVELGCSGPLSCGTGIVFLEVPHEGNTQESAEEAEVISSVLAQLESSQVRDEEGLRRLDRTCDVLVVAPYNMQVRRLRDRLGEDVPVGSVDKFQGQQAPVVVLSMCSSSLEDAARGAEFLLSPNRINVAVSRAQCLAVVVGSPAVLRARCTSIREMKLMNLFCWLRGHAVGDGGSLD